ncbi:MAG TPA: sigma-70 family RNA polymerase sigma factor [Xanthobacteraceae bacterium]|jgi:RNA polymerase sigma-70 factor (ECF subfamily)|nr:sigma-70 family RNA polymerase sigma factor [Xanthobacteraceae bacterium]
MTATLSTRDALLAQIPDLRASAFLLCGSKDRADDLVQETVLSAWAHLDDFQVGTNMGAWLFTILRNRFRTEYRKSRRWVQDVDGRYAEQLTSTPEQEGWSISADLRYALAQLPAHQREAIILVGAKGMSLVEAAAACGCEVGTIKSRTNRARVRLAALLAYTRQNADELEEKTARNFIGSASSRSAGSQVSVRH